MTITMKSVTTAETLRAQVTGTASMHSNPGGCNVDNVTGMHCSRRTKKKLIVHPIIKPITAQVIIENALPRNILLYRNNILHFANPSGRTPKTKYVKRV